MPKTRFKTRAVAERIWRTSSLLGLFHRRFFFFGVFVVPGVVAQAQLWRQGLGLAFGHFAAFVEELFDQVVIGGLFLNVFHHRSLSRESAPTP